MPLLEVKDLQVRYGNLIAVHAIDLSLEEGEVAVLLGPNGAGKSSTLNAISGISRSVSGSVRFRGKEITGWRPHRIAQAGLVQVPEGRHIVQRLTVHENLVLGGYNLPSKNRRAELLATVHDMFPVLVERGDAAGGLLSGGEQQMLAFGRALMADPEVLLLDEPSMGLAPIMVGVVMSAVKEIADRGISILMVEQNAVAAFDVASTAHVLEQGEIILRGAVDRVRDHPLVLQAFLGLEVDPKTESSPN